MSNYCKNPACCREIPDNKEYCSIACQMEDESLDEDNNVRIKIKNTKEQWQ